MEKERDNIYFYVFEQYFLMYTFLMEEYTDTNTSVLHTFSLNLKTSQKAIFRIREFKRLRIGLCDIFPISFSFNFPLQIELFEKWITNVRREWAGLPGLRHFQVLRVLPGRRHSAAFSAAAGEVLRGSRFVLLGSWPTHFCRLRGGKRLFHRYWVSRPALPATIQSRHCVLWVFCEGLFDLGSARYRFRCRNGPAALPGVGREGKGGGREACCTRGAM
eukprot:bmy_22012T0